MLFNGADESVLQATMYGLVAFFLIQLWPSAALAMKRLKDMDQSPWLVLVYFIIAFVPCIGGLLQLCMWIWMLITEGTIGPNQYGPDPIDRMPPM